MESPNLGFFVCDSQIVGEFLKQKDLEIHAISGDIRWGIFKIKNIKVIIYKKLNIGISQSVFSSPTIWI